MLRTAGADHKPGGIYIFPHSASLWCQLCQAVGMPGICKTPRPMTCVPGKQDSTVTVAVRKFTGCLLVTTPLLELPKSLFGWVAFPPAKLRHLTLHGCYVGPVLVVSNLTPSSWLGSRMLSISQNSRSFGQYSAAHLLRPLVCHTAAS